MEAEDSEEAEATEEVVAEAEAILRRELAQVITSQHQELVAQCKDSQSRSERACFLTREMWTGVAEYAHYGYLSSIALLTEGTELHMTSNKYSSSQQLQTRGIVPP